MLSVTRDARKRILEQLCLGHVVRPVARLVVLGPPPCAVCSSFLLLPRLALGRSVPRDSFVRGTLHVFSPLSAYMQQFSGVTRVRPTDLRLGLGHWQRSGKTQQAVRARAKACPWPENVLATCAGGQLRRVSSVGRSPVPKHGPRLRRCLSPRVSLARSGLAEFPSKRESLPPVPFDAMVSNCPGATVPWLWRAGSRRPKKAGDFGLGSHLLCA